MKNPKNKENLRESISETELTDLIMEALEVMINIRTMKTIKGNK